MDYQWYPGHMTRAKRMMQENIKLIDLLIELTDARAPLSGRNPDIDALAQGKARVIVLNKSDLADEAANRAWKEYFEKKGFLACLTDSRSSASVTKVKTLVDEACRQKIERVPNVGKSTFINSFAGKAVAKTGNKPGVTKGKQWIRLNGNVELLDTPGILWPKFEDQQIGRRLAVLGSIRDELQDFQELGLWLADYLLSAYPEALADRYRISASTADEELLNEIARARGCLKNGGILDTERAAQLLIDDYRSGKLGRLSCLPDRLKEQRQRHEGENPRR